MSGLNKTTVRIICPWCDQSTRVLNPSGLCSECGNPLIPSRPLVDADLNDWVEDQMLRRRERSMKATPLVTTALIDWASYDSAVQAPDGYVHPETLAGATAHGVASLESDERPPEGQSRSRPDLGPVGNYMRRFVKLGGAVMGVYIVWVIVWDLYAAATEGPENVMWWGQSDITMLGILGICAAVGALVWRDF